MSGVVQSITVKDRMRLAARRAASVNDPSAAFLQALADRCDAEEEHEAAFRDMLGRAEQRAVEREEQAKERVARTSLLELAGAADRLVVSRYWRMLLIWVGCSVLACVVSGAIGYYTNHLKYEECASQDGGVWCRGWLIMPQAKQ
jgi:hypothetical protein